MGGREIPVVTGANGMLGRELAEVCGAAHPATVAATRDEIDITDYWAMRWDLERLEATVVINCAAFTDVDRCETEPRRAERINGEGPGNLARACSEIGARLIHISTDFVFDGALDRPYRESDPTNPVSVYGQSKLVGEKAVLQASPEAMIVRCSWLYGRHGGNFIAAILAAARRGERLRIVDDQQGTPTYAGDLARAILRLLDIPHRGLLHFANAGVCSRMEFAAEALRLAGFGGVAVERIRTADTGRAAPRPPYSALDTSLFTEVTGEAPRRWQATLHDYLGID
jgi:dTDP-4-dehydrorhamnose reductase